MENNKVATFDSNYKVLHVEDFKTADAAYEYYTDCLRVLKKLTPKGEKIILARFRWGEMMHYEIVVGTH